MTGPVPRSGFQRLYYQNPKARGRADSLVFFPCDFSYAFAKFICKNGFFCFKWFLCHIADLMGAFYGIWNHKNPSLCHFQAIKSLWHTVHNIQFAKSQEKPHKKAKCVCSTSCTCRREKSFWILVVLPLKSTPGTVPVKIIIFSFKITFENKPN